jgi:hypothetical protein
VGCTRGHVNPWLGTTYKYNLEHRGLHRAKWLMMAYGVC